MDDVVRLDALWPRCGMTNSGFLSLVASSLVLLGTCFGFDKASAERGLIQTNPDHLPVKFRFRANHDPAHGGLAQEFSLKRTKGKYFVIGLASRHFPRPGETDFKPGMSERKEERALDESERFFTDSLMN